jgi:hypothetical protein
MFRSFIRPSSGRRYKHIKKNATEELDCEGEAFSKSHYYFMDVYLLSDVVLPDVVLPDVVLSDVVLPDNSRMNDRKVS